MEVGGSELAKRWNNRRNGPNAETVQAELGVLEGNCVPNCWMSWSYFQHDWEQMWRDKAYPGLIGKGPREGGPLMRLFAIV